MLEFHYGWQGLQANSKPAAQGDLEIMPLEGSTLLRRFARTWISRKGI